MGLRMHVAVARGRERLDREIEIVDVTAGRHVRDRLVADPVEAGEDRVEGEKHQRRAGDEGGPGGRHAAMADVGPEIQMQAFGNDLAAADPDDTRLGDPFTVAVQHPSFVSRRGSNALQWRVITPVTGLAIVSLSCVFRTSNLATNR